MSGIAVTELHVYPIKSCAPAEVDLYRVGPYGLLHDREWMVARPNGVFLSQRAVPELARIKTRLSNENLHISVPDIGSYAIALDAAKNDREEVGIDIFKKAGTAVDEGDEIAEMLSDYLNKSVRLLRSKQPRPVNPECRVPGTSDEVAFADGFPFLLASRQSLADLGNAAKQYIPMNRFRPNIVVDGEGLGAYDEDYWRAIRIGRMTASVVRACARCPMPNVDQKRGILAPAEERFVTAVLEKTRKGIDPLNGRGEVFFAQNVSHVYEKGTVLRVDDPVEITRRSEERNWLSSAA